MKINKISENGLNLIKQFEGFSSHPYPDPGTGDLPITIGYGSTYYEDGTKIKMSDSPISKERATELLKNTVTIYERTVDSYTRDDINQNQFDALVSFCYNVGVANLKISTLLKLVNVNPNDPNIKLQFKRWNKANGKVMEGLTKRRIIESELYFKV